MCNLEDDSREIKSFFGDTSVSNYCGKIKDLPQERKDSVNEKLTSVFKKMGKTDSVNGNSTSDSFGRSNCVKDAKGGALAQPSDKEYLGYCKNLKPQENDQEMYFLNINKTHHDDRVKSALNIKFCGNNCGTGVSSAGEILNGIQQGERQQTQNGKDVEFYKYLTRE